MLKINKKALSVFLAMVMMFSLAASAFAAKSPTEIDSNIIEKVNNALNYISPQKEQFGLGDVDFSTLSIGDEILAYEYTNNNLTPLDFCLHPLSSNGVLVAFAIKENDGSINITTALVDEIKEHITFDTAFALVYDSCSCYIYTKDGLTELVKSNEISENRGVISEKSVKFDSIQLTDCEAIQGVGYNADVSVQNQTALLSNYISLNVPFVTQFPPNTNPPSYICWAASVACIGNYLTGYIYSARDIAEYLYGSVNWNQSASNASALSLLRSIYNVPYTEYPYVPSTNTIMAAINGNYPIYSYWFNSQSGVAHSMVIYGINAISGYISIMDPQHGFASAQANGSSYTYRSLYNSLLYTLYYYGL